MEMKKGFVYTLEAVIASALFLGVALAVLPDDVDSQQPEVIQTTMHSTLEALDKTGRLRDNLTITELENDIDSYVPATYSFAVNKNVVKTDTYRLEDGESTYLSSNGDYSELQIWFQDASGLNITFNGTLIVDQRDGPGYVRRNVPGSEGWLNLTGNGEAVIDFDTYKQQGESVEDDDLTTVSYVVQKNGTKEIQVKLWNEDEE